MNNLVPTPMADVNKTSKAYRKNKATDAYLLKTLTPENFVVTMVTSQKRANLFKQKLNTFLQFLIMVSDDASKETYYQGVINPPTVATQHRN